MLSKGLIWKLVSCFCFASANTLVHGLGLHSALPAVQMAATQTAVAGVILYIIWHRSIQWRAFRPHLTWLALRGFFAAIAIFCWIKALTVLPFMQVVTFKLATPFFLFVAAYLFLGERLSARRWHCLGLALLGGAVLFYDDFRHSPGDQFDINAMTLALPLLSILGSTASTLVAKKMSPNLSPAMMTLGLLLFTLPWFLLDYTAIFTPIQAIYIPQLCAMGALAAMAYFSLHKAIELSDLMVLAPVTLSRFVLGAFFSIVCFGEWPSLSVYGGSALIIGAILFVDRPFDRKKRP